LRHRRLLRAVALTTPVLTVALTATAQLSPAQAAQAAPGAPARAQHPAALTPAQARALSRNVTDKVIIVFRNQETGLPDTRANAARRTAAVRSVQSQVRSELTATHARNVKSFSLINAMSATVSPGEATRLRANPAVSQVTADLPIPVASSVPTIRHARARTITALPGACPAKGKVQLDPEALGNIHAAGSKQTAQGLGYTGAGVKVGWIADGLDINNPDFIRANGQHVFVDYQDFSGTGTNAPTDGGEAFLDASSIAAQGRHTYNVAGYGEGLSKPCDIRILGVAPGASMVGLNVFGSSNVAFNSVFLEAVNYAVTVDHVNVLNESFGSNPFPDDASLDLTRMADDDAVKAGVTVVASTGDAGVTNTIGSPGTDPLVLSAGATTTYRAYAQTGIGGITTPGVTGWLDNNISGLSSGGFTQTGRTVDVVAPGDLNWTLCTPKPALYAACTNFAGKPSSVDLSGGTSEASPLTAGTAALVIQAYARAHHGHDPSPAVVRRIIISTAQNIDAPADQQGAGIVDAYQAVLAAASYPGAAHRTGHAVLTGSAQLNAVGQPGTTEHLSERLTNDGASKVTLGLSSRTLGAYAAVSTKSLSLTAASGYTTEVTFTVPKGQARLNASVALQGLVNLSLISPSHKLAEYNLPQGFGNYGNAQVADPQAGTWTALVNTESDAASVPAKFQASVAAWASFGTLSAHSLTLAPGASGTVGLTVATPAQPGDQSGSILVTSPAAQPGFAAVTSVPVTVRSLIPAPNPAETFIGTLTGGNGRAANTGQTAYYQVQLPAGLKAVNVSVKTPDPANTMLATLVNPDGEAISTAFNGLETTTASGSTQLTPEDGAQLHVLAPGAGRWSLIVDFFNTVSGTAVAQPFTVTVNDVRVTATAAGLPDSTSTQLAAGTPVTVPVQVTNNGSTPEAYFVDARLGHQVTAALAPQTVSSITLPNLAGVVPEFLVPSHTTSISAKVTGPKSLFFDYSSPFGDPDLISTFGKTATGSLTAPEVAPGIWSITPFLTGPTGATAAKSITADLSMSAVTAAFDGAVSAPTGDLWSSSTNATAGFTPYVVEPGQSVTIPVTITPSGAAGSTVSGTLYLSDASIIPSAPTYNGLPGLFPEASDVAAFPYQYKIK
jgi:hypothetical protein